MDMNRFVNSALSPINHDVSFSMELSDPINDIKEIEVIQNPTQLYRELNEFIGTVKCLFYHA